jgi:protein SCO1/2|tara:strand:+ start:234 stop:908 length:675 start_codon:yes stop_codon:yes gene_type:complete
MDFKFKKYRGFITIFLIVSSGILILFYNALDPERRLPIYQPSMVNYELVDSTLQHVKKFHKIAPFTLTNQNGKIVTEQDYDNKIYVADFFFTTCPTICPKMTENMGQLQNEYLEDSQIKFISFSVTPQVDSVQQLKKYAIEKGVNDSKWNLVTGNKKEIYSLARKSYLAVKDDGDGGQFDMIHTENFILVDPEKRIRGFYDGTDIEAMNTLITDISILKEEFPQ